MIINAENVGLLYEAYNGVFQRGFARGASEVDKVATTVPSTTASEHYAWLGQWPKLREWVGDKIVKQIEGHDYSLKNKDYESTVGVDRNALKDDVYGVYAPMFEEMGYAAAIHPTELVMSLLAAGGTTLCYDGQNFFDSDHPVEVDGVEASVTNQDTGGGGDYWYLLDASRPLKPLIYQRREAYEFVQKTEAKDDNVFFRKQYLFGVEGRGNAGFGFWQQAFRSAQTLNATNFVAARKAMRNFKSNEGRKLGIKPTLVVVGAGNEQAARDLFLTERNANGSTNNLNGAVEILVSNQID